MQSKILIATTTWWATPARLASTFAKQGARVSGVYPHGSPIEKVRALEAGFRYRAVQPVRCLRRAIEAADPDLIVPCDDRVVEHLHQLHRESVATPNGKRLCGLIERSLGAPEGYSAARSRGELMELAEDCGIRVPETAVVQSRGELGAFLEAQGFPAVLKVDGTWGGAGVRVVHSLEEAEAAFDELTARMTVRAALAHVSFHDLYSLFSPAGDAGPGVTAQRYIRGASANAMFACWEGEVLDGLGVRVVYAREELGSSTVVQTLQHSEMEQAGCMLARRLGISGFFGLDFIVEASTGQAYLTELNPRATQLGHLEPGGRPALVHALLSRLAGEVAATTAECPEETIAFFPNAFRCDPKHPIFETPNLRYDVPVDEPELTRELMRTPWNNRHLSARLHLAAHGVLQSSRSLRSRGRWR